MTCGAHTAPPCPGLLGLSQEGSRPRHGLPVVGFALQDDLRHPGAGRDPLIIADRSKPTRHVLMRRLMQWDRGAWPRCGGARTAGRWRRREDRARCWAAGARSSRHCRFPVLGPRERRTIGCPGRRQPPGCPEILQIRRNSDPDNGELRLKM